MKIDVVMPTYNSCHELFPLVLGSISKYIPVNRLIVVDRFSSDCTIDVIKRVFPTNSLILRTRANLAYARYIGIKYVETEWFAFIDSDAIILPMWFKELSKFINHAKVGAVEGGCLQLSNLRGLLNLKSLIKISSRAIIVNRKLSIKELGDVGIVKRGLNPSRGTTVNTLVRTDVVRDWKPNPMLSAYEDFSLTQHVINKGYLWLVHRRILCLHGVPPSNIISKLRLCIRKGLWEGASIKYAGISWRKIILYAISRLIGSLIRLFKEENPYPLMMFTAFTLSLPTDKYIAPKR